MCLACTCLQSTIVFLYEVARGNRERHKMSNVTDHQLTHIFRNVTENRKTYQVVFVPATAKASESGEWVVRYINANSLAHAKRLASEYGKRISEQKVVDVFPVY